jgi:hypothetical protein
MKRGCFAAQWLHRYFWHVRSILSSVVVSPVCQADCIVEAGSPYLKERLNTVNLLELTSLDQLLLKMPTLFTFSQNKPA